MADIHKAGVEYIGWEMLDHISHESKVERCGREQSSFVYRSLFDGERCTPGNSLGIATCFGNRRGGKIEARDPSAPNVNQAT